mgnify:CR=1 FL=1|nr:MAG TPA: hypothetical protein [Herelleviridae sp.]
MSKTGKNFKTLAVVFLILGIFAGLLLGALVPVVSVELSDSPFSDSIWDEPVEYFNTGLCFSVMAGFEVLAFFTYIAGKHFEKQDTIIYKLSLLVPQALFASATPKSPSVPKEAAVVKEPVVDKVPSAIPDDPDDRNIYSSSKKL